MMKLEIILKPAIDKFTHRVIWKTGQP